MDLSIRFSLEHSKSGSKTMLYVMYENKDLSILRSYLLQSAMSLSNGKPNTVSSSLMCFELKNLTF